MLYKSFNPSQHINDNIIELINVKRLKRITHPFIIAYLINIQIF